MQRFRLIATTQYREFYGDDAGNGRWKCKGGVEYILASTDDPNVAFNMTKTDITALVETHASRLNYCNDLTEEYLVDVEWVEGLTEDEQYQVEAYGKVVYPHHDLTFKEAA